MAKSERLKSFRCKQPQLRVDKYKCLHESLINEDVDAARLSKKTILPSTFTGGPRYMMNNCKDAFVIYIYARYPNYFITMTCNPKWDEIKREVTPIGLKTEDRPDILCRVFKIKLDGLIDDLKEKKNFDVCTIEFQKRVLSHAHILLFMSNKFKPQTLDDINKHITAEIPHKNEMSNLRGTVQNYMKPHKLLRKLGITTIVGTSRHVRQSGLFGYEIQEKESFVIRLPFHLEDEQLMVYSETSNVNDIVERAISQVHVFGTDGGEHVISLCSKSDLC
ncbi:uncharacterized protein LOC127744089 [Arachis duranensis]|uniref:Uncharacterized protein LOC107461979 n=1 Tax=Arachis duranensis TaxID=130453 RepID=A0A6P4B9J8_ARADU|nr:uncharacterized protein LOC107461979 [Arachis duranensis]XP_052112321.1 uncharacterized protein LOC127744089 [Arachis duranensis]